MGKPSCLLLLLLLKGTPEEATFPKLLEHGMALATWARKGVLDRGSEMEGGGWNPRAEWASSRGVSQPLHSEVLILAAARPGIIAIHWPMKEAGPAEPTLDHHSHGPQGLLAIHRDTTLLCLRVAPFLTTTWHHGSPALPAAVYVALPTWGPTKDLGSGARLFPSLFPRLCPGGLWGQGLCTDLDGSADSCR